MFKRVLIGACLVAILTILGVESKARNGPIEMMNLMQRLLVDPQYLGLSDNEQLFVLETLYAIVEASYTERMKETRKLAM